MKLLLFVHSLGCGGAERAAANLANYWADKLWEIAIITLDGIEQDFYELRPTIRRISLNLAVDSGNAIVGVRNNVRRVRALQAALAELRPDVAVALTSKANILLALAARKFRWLQTIGSERAHPPAVYLGPAWSILRRFSYGALGAIVAQTREMSRWLEIHTNARCVATIPNGVPWPLPVAKPAIFSEGARHHGQRVALAVGRLEHEKGFDLLIEAFAGVAKGHADWDLTILGEGSLRRGLQQQLARLGLHGRVQLGGRAENMADWYQAADLFVMTSRFEGFPNVLVEAMAHGLPAVSFDCDTGPRDIIRHEIDGLLVRPCDVANLNVALDRLMGDAALRTRLALRAMEVRERFSMEKVAGMWEALFAELRQ